MMSQRKTPEGGYRGLRGLSKASFTWKDPSDPSKPTSGVFPRGLSLGHHWRSIVYLVHNKWIGVLQLNLDIVGFLHLFFGPNYPEWKGSCLLLDWRVCMILHKKNVGISLINGILFIADKVKERKRLVQRYGYQGAGIINIQWIYPPLNWPVRPIAWPTHRLGDRPPQRLHQWKLQLTCALLDSHELW